MGSNMINPANEKIKSITLLDRSCTLLFRNYSKILIQRARYDRNVFSHNGNRSRLVLQLDPCY